MLAGVLLLLDIETALLYIEAAVTPCGLYNTMYSRKTARQVTGNDLFA